MKKIMMFWIFVFTLVANTAIANIDVLNHYRVGGSFHRSSVSLNEHNPNFNEPINLGSCSEVINYLDNTKEPTIAIWDYLGNELSGLCSAEEYYITTYVSSYYNICTLGDKDIDDLLEGGKVGVGDWYTVKKAASETLDGIGSDAQIVPYSTSRDYLIALEIGEIDYVYTHRPKSNMNCILSNDPNSTEVTYTGTLYDGPFKNFSSDISIIGKNVDKDEIQSMIIDASRNSNFVEIFPHLKPDFGLMFRGYQIEKFEKMLEEFE